MKIKIFYFISISCIVSSIIQPAQSPDNSISQYLQSIGSLSGSIPAGSSVQQPQGILILTPRDRQLLNLNMQILTLNAKELSRCCDYARKLADSEYGYDPRILIKESLESLNPHVPIHRDLNIKFALNFDQEKEIYRAYHTKLLRQQDLKNSACTQALHNFTSTNSQQPQQQQSTYTSHTRK